MACASRVRALWDQPFCPLLRGCPGLEVKNELLLWDSRVVSFTGRGSTVCMYVCRSVNGNYYWNKTIVAVTIAWQCISILTRSDQPV